MSMLKKLAVGAASVVGSVVPAVAQESGSLSIDTAKAEQAVTAVGTAISGLISGKITENIFIVLGAGLIITFVFLGVRWMLRGGKTAAK